MAAGEVQVTVIGNLTADPKPATVGGKQVANFTIASTPRTFDRAAGEWRDGEPLFLRCSVWREMAEHVVASLQKGARVIAQGRLKQRSFEAGGGTRTVIELEVDEIGPSLRYATAQVARRGGGRSQDAGASWTGQEQGWGAAEPGAGWGQ